MNTNIDELKKRYPLTLNRDVNIENEFISKRFDKAWQIAKDAAVLLKDNYKASKVFAFGSLTKRSSFNRWSDIDLAVEGVPDEIFYSAVGAVIGLSTEFKVDLVDIKDCGSSLRNTIEMEGIII